MRKNKMEDNAGVTRRSFIQNVGMTTAGFTVAPLLISRKVFGRAPVNGIVNDKRKDENCQRHSKDVKEHIKIIKKTIYSDYKGMYHKPNDILPFPYITPGSVYSNELWDWDSWLSNIALRQILLDIGTQQDRQEALPHERGCILDFLKYGGKDGWLPIVVWHNANPRENLPGNIYTTNMHKPVLAQHAAFLVKSDNGNAEWLRDQFWKMQAFMTNYESHSKNEPTGLYFWQDDVAIGGDNDPATFYRPHRSSGSIFLNSLMYKELEAMAYLSGCLKMDESTERYTRAAVELKNAIREHCWDERDGFYYSVDLDLLPINNKPGKYLGITFVFNSGHPRDYNCLIQRLGVWSGFLPMWCGIATPEEAERMVNEHYRNEKTFNAPFGIRSLSKMEKMYAIYPSSNPSDWQGPIWIITNYLVFRGLLKYGYRKEAREMALKTINLLGKDASKAGAFHEYYDPETGKPIINKGFQNWNYLVMNMIAWLENKSVIEEF
jgi:putative isomerase